jgi:hypothetical protein
MKGWIHLDDSELKALMEDGILDQYGIKVLSISNVSNDESDKELYELTIDFNEANALFRAGVLTATKRVRQKK